MTTTIAALEQELTSAVTPLNRLTTLNKLAEQLIDADTQSALNFATEANQLAQRLDIKKAVAKSLLTMAQCYYRLSNTSLSITAATDAHNAFETLNDRSGVAASLTATGAAYFKMGDYPQALNFHEKALKISCQVNDAQNEAKALHGIGLVNWSTDNYAEALVFFQQSLSITQRIGDKTGEAFALNSLGALHGRMGEYHHSIKFLEQSAAIFQSLGNRRNEADSLGNLGSAHGSLGNHITAIEYHQKCLLISESIKDYHLGALTLNGIGVSYRFLCDYIKALDFQQRSLDMAKLLGHKPVELRALIELGDIYEKLGRFDESLEYLHESLQLAIILQIQDHIFRAHLGLATVYEQKSDFQNALLHHKAYREVEKKIFNEESDSRIKSLQVLHQVEQTKKDAELDRQKAAKLKELDEFKSRFFANISHEFRTPLTLILGSMDDLLSSNLISPLTDTLQVAQRNARKLLLLVNELLDLSRLDAGKLSLSISQENLVPFLRNTVSCFSSLAGQKQISLVFHTDVDAMSVCFDAEKLEKVVSNVISNALKFTPNGGAVHVSLALSQQAQSPTDAQPADTATITISDTGTGIAEEELPHVFDRFYQVGKNHAEGTGIGLALAKELVEFCRGKIEAKSAIGKGTTFVITLPVSAAAFSADEFCEHEISDHPTHAVQVVAALQSMSSERAIHSPSASPPVKHVPLILIVEDNLEMSDYIRRHLQPEFRIITAVSGTDALAKADKEIPDLIVSDVMMPEMDGYTLCRRLKQSEATSHIPVVLLTAKSSEDSKLEGLETGADDYLTKPFSPKELLTRIRNLIEQRHRLRERYSRMIRVESSFKPATSTDDAFLQRATTAVEKHLANEAYQVDDLAKDIHLSRKQLYRKLLSLTNLSPEKFIRTLRLKRAAQLLGGRTVQVSEAAYQVGFGSASYFAKCFREEFGVLPSAYSASSSLKSKK